MNSTYEESRNQGLQVIAALLFLMGLFLGLKYLFTEFRIIEVLTGHAWEQHGVEVNAAVKCLNENGSYQSFKTKGFTDRHGRPIFTNLWLCFDGEDFYAVVTTRFLQMGSDVVARLVTAYKISTDLFPTLDDFLVYIAEKWAAVEINYVISPGNILLWPK